MTPGLTRRTFASMTTSAPGRRPTQPLPLPDPEPAAVTEQQPATEQPQPAPVLRLCGFCNTRQPLTGLGQVADSLQCLDVAACQERAAKSGLYPMLAEASRVRTARRNSTAATTTIAVAA